MTKQNITMKGHEIVVSDWSKVLNPAEVEGVLLDTIDRGLYRASGRTISVLRDDLNTLYRLLEKQPARGITGSFRRLIEDLVDDFNKTPTRNLNVAMLDDRKLSKAEFDNKNPKKDKRSDDDTPTRGKSKDKRSDDDTPTRGKSKDGHGGNAFTKSDLSSMLDKKLGPIVGVMPTDKNGKKFVKVAAKKDLDKLEDKVTGLQNRLGKKGKKGKFVYYNLARSGGPNHPFNWWGGLIGLIAFVVMMFIVLVWGGAVFSFALVLSAIVSVVAAFLGSLLTSRN